MGPFEQGGSLKRLLKLEERSRAMPRQATGGNGSRWAGRRRRRWQRGTSTPPS
jgi:hypothetical protein